ncbi:MAG TPA: bifunctional diaminohydroxyphosphoribosylaminopyrimidine deaminase/5-amino-6-(5-phosphoribosylamino)uracil reductase RibD [Stellaceae bacterium]|nr:bifunctional diaminohydroxyphosphoribosylaminopyrimidine deaminase/5-amino-6-(5-phosphoribosylamino)uracil reductase RibD [Stellaceae bacterium]
MASEAAAPEQDRAHMRAALALARRGLGTTWPNPAVGCVIVRDGRVIGRGWTQPGGRPHAETEALRRAGETAQGATAYVSLEPCAHWGKTPPCAEALIAAGLGRIVAALEDPDRRVAGRGLRRLAAAGIAVESGLLAAEAAEINAGFFCRVRQGRPLVTLKLATSLDGRIATAQGESRWITGPPARARAHLLRACHDAVMVGTGTALADNPELTCRLPGLQERSPVRIVLDRSLRLPSEMHLVAAARRVSTWLLTLPDADPARRARLTDNGVTVIEVPPDPKGGLDLVAALRALGERGLTRLLVEGGARLAASLLHAGLVDRLAWLHAPLLLGGDGVPAIAGFDLAALADAPGFTRIAVEEVGADVLTTLRIREREVE